MQDTTGRWELVSFLILCPLQSSICNLKPFQEMGPFTSKNDN